MPNGKPEPIKEPPVPLPEEAPPEPKNIQNKSSKKYQFQNNEKS